MPQEKQGAPPNRRLLLLLLLLLNHLRGVRTYGENKKFGDKCGSNQECGFEGAFCDEISGKCLCKPELPATNHLDKCGVVARINETCFFNEQCERAYYMSECKDGVCVCKFQRQAIVQKNGSIDCIPVANADTTPKRFVDPAMIGILVAMFFMFITICIVLRLFSRARWRETRTIFNTPNPRLMNASLLRDTKHHERRGSKGSHGNSRPESVVSLPRHSPNSADSRRGSKGSNVSGGTEKPKSPSHTTPMLESVTVQIKEHSHKIHKEY